MEANSRFVAVSVTLEKSFHVPLPLLSPLQNEGQKWLLVYIPAPWG